MMISRLWALCSPVYPFLSPYPLPEREHIISRSLTKFKNITIFLPTFLWFLDLSRDFKDVFVVLAWWLKENLIKSVALKRQKSEKVKYAIRVAMCVATLKLIESRTEIVMVTLWLRMYIHGFFVKLWSSAHSCSTIACERSNKQNNSFPGHKKTRGYPPFPSKHPHAKV